MLHVNTATLQQPKPVERPGAAAPQQSSKRRQPPPKKASTPQPGQQLPDAALATVGDRGRRTQVSAMLRCVAGTPPPAGGDAASPTPPSQALTPSAVRREAALTTPAASTPPPRRAPAGRLPSLYAPSASATPSPGDANTTTAASDAPSTSPSSLGALTSVVSSDGVVSSAVLRVLKTLVVAQLGQHVAVSPLPWGNDDAADLSGSDTSDSDDDEGGVDAGDLRQVLGEMDPALREVLRAKMARLYDRLRLRYAAFQATKASAHRTAAHRSGGAGSAPSMAVCALMTPERHSADVYRDAVFSPEGSDARQRMSPGRSTSPSSLLSKSVLAGVPHSPPKALGRAMAFHRRGVSPPRQRPPPMVHVVDAERDRDGEASDVAAMMRHFAKAMEFLDDSGNDAHGVSPRKKRAAMHPALRGGPVAALPVRGAAGDVQWDASMSLGGISTGATVPSPSNARSASRSPTRRNTRLMSFASMLIPVRRGSTDDHGEGSLSITTPTKPRYDIPSPWGERHMSITDDGEGDVLDLLLRRESRLNRKKSLAKSRKATLAQLTSAAATSENKDTDGDGGAHQRRLQRNRTAQSVIFSSVASRASNMSAGSHDSLHQLIGARLTSELAGLFAARDDATPDSPTNMDMQAGGVFRCGSDSIRSGDGGSRAATPDDQQMLALAQEQELFDRMFTAYEAPPVGGRHVLAGRGAALECEVQDDDAVAFQNVVRASDIRRVSDLRRGTTVAVDAPEGRSQRLKSVAPDASINEAGRDRRATTMRASTSPAPAAASNNGPLLGASRDVENHLSASGRAEALQRLGASSVGGMSGSGPPRAGASGADAALPPGSASPTYMSAGRKAERRAGADDLGLSTRGAGRSAAAAPAATTSTNVADVSVVVDGAEPTAASTRGKNRGNVKFATSVDSVSGWSATGGDSADTSSVMSKSATSAAATSTTTGAGTTAPAPLFAASGMGKAPAAGRQQQQDPPRPSPLRTDAMAASVSTKKRAAAPEPGSPMSLKGRSSTGVDAKKAPAAQPAPAKGKDATPPPNNVQPTEAAASSNADLQSSPKQRGLAASQQKPAAKQQPRRATMDPSSASPGRSKRDGGASPPPATSVDTDGDTLQKKPSSKNLKKQQEVPYAPPPKPQGPQFSGVTAADVWKRTYAAYGSPALSALPIKKPKKTAPLQAVVAAMSTYHDERIPACPMAEHDADAVAMMFEAFGYHVTRVFGRSTKTTGAAIQAATQKAVAAASAAGEGGLCIVYVAGRGTEGTLHGLDGVQHYVLHSDTKLSAVSRHNVFFPNELTAISEGAVRPIVFAEMHPINIKLKGIPDLSVGCGFALVRTGTASSDLTFRYPSRATGVFTWYLLKGLQGDAVRSGKVTPGLLNAFVYSALLHQLKPKKSMEGEAAMLSQLVRMDGSVQLVSKENQQFKFKKQLEERKLEQADTACRFVVDLTVDVAYLENVDKWLRAFMRKVHQLFYPDGKWYSKHKCKAVTVYRCGQFLLKLDPAVVSGQLAKIVREGSCDDEVTSMTGATFGSVELAGRGNSDSRIKQSWRTDYSPGVASYLFAPKYRLVHGASLVQVTTTYPAKFDSFGEPNEVYADGSHDPEYDITAWTKKAGMLMAPPHKATAEAEAKAAAEATATDAAAAASGDAPLPSPGEAPPPAPAAAAAVPAASKKLHVPAVPLCPETMESATQWTVHPALVPSVIYDTYYVNNTNRFNGMMLQGVQEKVSILFEANDRDFLQMMKHGRLGSFHTKLLCNADVVRVQYQAGDAVFYRNLAKLQALVRGRYQRGVMSDRLRIARRHLRERAKLEEQWAAQLNAIKASANGTRLSAFESGETAVRQQQWDEQHSARCELINIMLRVVSVNEQPYFRTRLQLVERVARLDVEEAATRSLLFVRAAAHSQLRFATIQTLGMERDKRRRIENIEESDRQKIKTMLHAGRARM